LLNMALLPESANFQKQRMQNTTKIKFD